jgi:two-component system C4-dicarboxylate transport response regulator DctD
MSDPTPAILILVDDDAPVLAALTFAFEVDGYCVRAFANAESLLNEPDLCQRGCLIVDYKLPGLNGLELLKRLRSRGVNLPAVLITTPTPAVRAAAAAQNVPVVAKPLLTSTLRETVRHLLEEDARSSA